MRTHPSLSWFRVKSKQRLLVLPYFKVVRNWIKVLPKEGAVHVMETVYEIQRIKQVISELEGGEKYLVLFPQDGARVAALFIGEDDREMFFVMCLNTKNRVIAIYRCHVGALNSSIVHPKGVCSDLE